MPTNSNMKIALAFALIASLISIISCQWVINDNCQHTCGDVSIPYPFGIGESCALDTTFIINCDNTSNPPKPFLANYSVLPVIDVSLDGYFRKYTYVAHDCFTYNQTGKYRNTTKPWSKLHDNKFFSSNFNKFTVLGCDTYATFSGMTINGRFFSGCVSYCLNKSAVVNGSCSGIGCCQTSIPSGLLNFSVSLKTYSKHANVYSFNPCSYAFITDANYFDFTTVELLSMPETVPTVIDWVIGNQSCEAAVKNITSYACKSNNSKCYDYDNGPGYRCNCTTGYAGNPYLPHGCVDIDECQDPSLHDCIHRCHNHPGNYTCSCPKWYRGDGIRNGKGCKLDNHSIILVIIGDLILLTAIVLGVLILYSFRRKRMQVKLKEKFFHQNGGYILLDKISQNEASSNSINAIKIFKSEELQEATDYFDESRICGQGGFGTVYKGHLSNGDIVAIKKSKIVDQDQVEQFINEITILSQVKHRNVVRFLGCCLETPVPLLVYEFITNGTLSDHLHDDHRPILPWKTRLKVAAQTAGVLAYLHTDHSPQIIHRDIKPTNILLDDDFTSRVSDFGASRLNPKNEIEMCTMVKGTLGYLDPEYLQTSQLTEKSDVYSFGVVLFELLTRQKAVSFDRSEEDRSLVIYFMSLTIENDMLAIFDKSMLNENNIEETKQVAKIAKRCVRVNGDERPTMKEVATELESLLKESKHQRVTKEASFKETDQFLGEPTINPYGYSIEMTGYSAKPEELLLKIDDGR